MDEEKISFKNKILRRTENLSDFLLYKAALEWGLVVPIVIENRDDLKSEYRWRDRVSPYNHQVANLITFCRRLPVTLLADDVGLGKTISAGLVMSELISRGRLNKILIVCPKILREQWREELKTKFDIPSVIATGKELVTIKAPGDAGAVITTYQSARLYLDKIERTGYEMLILDEAHKLRNLYGVDPAPQVAIRFRKALQDRLFKYVLMLTATPIQNRLWDLYSLIDLLTVARGHENPFGSEGIFARRFIEDNKNQARRLKPESKDEFRSIVYGYMSRIRRGDANLHFPERIIKLYSVEPTREEKELFNTVAKPIQKLNFLTQIAILQALVSSPESLVKILDGMALRETAPKELALSVKDIAKKIGVTAKLNGLGCLIENLIKEKPIDWRVVIFTTRRETQTSIQIFLEKKGVACGLINGDSGKRNQETIGRFKKDLPEIHVIISTEAGSEGVNLQAANVLVNYDLPWNPMIVEQRIGRIQRLSSNFANVSIFNIVLKGTFEEYIVGRLMEKLQMASHAIGDVDSLLEASGMNEDENSTNSFEELIRQLVVASLVGKDTNLATLKAEKSIADAKIQLEQEEKNINSLLGKMDGAEESGPKCPKLPEPLYSMDIKTFVISALRYLGLKINEKSGEQIVTSDNGQEIIRFENSNLRSDSEFVSTLYAPGTPSFERLVTSISNKDLCIVDDIDLNVVNVVGGIAKKWVETFNGIIENFIITDVFRCFSGDAIVRVRATVACDSYERLVEVKCSPEEHCVNVGKNGLESVNEILENPSSAGVVHKYINEKSVLDHGIAEFCRFYNERRTQELNSAGNDPRKMKKVDDDFTPRIDAILVSLNGKVSRKISLNVSYKLDVTNKYESTITVIPSIEKVVDSPQLIKCERTGAVVPEQCIGKCEISGLKVLYHLLIPSEVSYRRALPEYIVICGLSGKHLLRDEVEISSMTGRLVDRALLKTSALSGKLAEPNFISKCEFSDTYVLENEVNVSQISGKKYRIDQQLKSSVSGKIGHRQEFIYCSETNVPLLPTESETCQITGHVVAPGILVSCEVSGKMVLPSELSKSVVSGKSALKKYFVLSSISGTSMLEQEGIKSSIGKFCIPSESGRCAWSERISHPDDLKICTLTGLPIYFEYISHTGVFSLEPLLLLLDGQLGKNDASDLWPDISRNLSSAIKSGQCKIEASVFSSNKNIIAVCAEVRTWAGLQTRYAGFLYSIKDKSIVGHVVRGKRTLGSWVQA